MRSSGLPLGPPQMMLVLLIIVTVSRVHQHYAILGRLRPALLLTAVSLGAAILYKGALNPGNLLHTWPAKIVAALAVAACLSAAFGISLGNSATYILKVYSKVLIVAFLLIAAIRGARDLSALVWAYVISCGILAWMATFVFRLHGVHRDTTGLMRLADLYLYDANDIGLVVLMGLPLTLLTLQTSKTRGKIVSAIILVGIGVTIARTGSRGAFLGVLAVGPALLLMIRGVSVAKRLALMAVAAVALFVAAPPGYWIQMKTLTDPKNDYNWDAETGRRKVALRGWGYFKQYPVFGLGIDNFGRAECMISDVAINRAAGSGIRCTPPHNTYLQVGAELGIVGFVLWMWLLFGGIYWLTRLRRRLPRWWARGDWEQRFIYLCSVYLPISLIGFAVSSTFLSFAYLDPIYIMAAFMAGLAIAAEKKLKEGRSLSRVPTRPVRRRAKVAWPGPVPTR